jgi:phosphohistidine phosphatase
MTMQTNNQGRILPPYDLYLVRHGATAKTARPGLAEEFQRPLTQEAIARLRRIGEGLKRLGVKPDWIVASPMVRTLQTADILAAILKPAHAMSTSNTLRPGSYAQELIPFLAGYPERRKVIAVGHEPDLSRLAGRLIRSNEGTRMLLKKGGCCRISLAELSPGTQGHLVWWLTPRILGRIA